MFQKFSFLNFINSCLRNDDLFILSFILSLFLSLILSFFHSFVQSWSPSIDSHDSNHLALTLSQRITKLLNCWIVEFLNCWIAESLNCRMSQLRNCWLAEYVNCWIAEFLNCWICWIAELVNISIADLPNCSIAQLLNHSIAQSLNSTMKQFLNCIINLSFISFNENHCHSMMFICSHSKYHCSKIYLDWNIRYLMNIILRHYLVSYFSFPCFKNTKFISETFYISHCSFISFFVARSVRHCNILAQLCYITFFLSDISWWHVVDFTIYHLHLIWIISPEDQFVELKLWHHHRYIVMIHMNINISKWWFDQWFQSRLISTFKSYIFAFDVNFDNNDHFGILGEELNATIERQWQSLEYSLKTMSWQEESYKSKILMASKFKNEHLNWKIHEGGYWEWYLSSFFEDRVDGDIYY
jgi:hypothetical protein